MATIADVKEQIENANALGRQNLTDKGIDVNGTETTYQLMQMIANISGGSGVSYTSITYNDDDTITLIDTDGTEHTMVCTYEGEKLASVTYGDKEISIGYEGEDLKSVGNTVIDLNGYWYTPTRNEITCTTAGEVMPGNCTKTNDGVAICGYCLRELNSSYFACFVGETAESVQANNLRLEPTAIEYNGKTYYYSSSEPFSSASYIKNAWFIGTYEDGYVNTSRFYCNEKAVTRLLDYYYCKIDE